MHTKQRSRAATRCTHRSTPTPLGLRIPELLPHHTHLHHTCQGPGSAWALQPLWERACLHHCCPEVQCCSCRQGLLLLLLCPCLCVCVRACMRMCVCVRVCVRACVCARARTDPPIAAATCGVNRCCHLCAGTTYMLAHTQTHAPWAWTPSRSTRSLPALVPLPISARGCLRGEPCRLDGAPLCARWL